MKAPKHIRFNKLATYHKTKEEYHQVTMPWYQLITSL